MFDDEESSEGEEEGQTSVIAQFKLVESPSTGNQFFDNGTVATNCFGIAGGDDKSTTTWKSTESNKEEVIKGLLDDPESLKMISDLINKRGESEARSARQEDDE
jgi:hypothetical protein